MTRTIKIKRLRYSSLFSLLFIGLAVWSMPLFLIAGILGCFGFDGIKSGDTYVHGLQALLYGIIGGPLFAGVMSFLLSVFVFPGILLFSLFRPMKIAFYEGKGSEQTGAANSRASGTSGTSDAEASAPPEASGNS